MPVKLPYLSQANTVKLRQRAGSMRHTEAPHCRLMLPLQRTPASMSAMHRPYIARN